MFRNDSFRSDIAVFPILRRALAGLFIFAALGLAAGCETTEGAGRDIENLGESIQDAAD